MVQQRSLAALIVLLVTPSFAVNGEFLEKAAGVELLEVKK